VPGSSDKGPPLWEGWHQYRLLEPRAPRGEPSVESFNGRSRDELLNVEDFADLPTARIVVEVPPLLVSIRR
jgi:hypothetical protein